MHVSIDTINGGQPYGAANASHPELYRNNDLTDGGGALDTEMDGLTVVMTCSAPVVPGGVNHIKLAIADVGDYRLDSNVFLEGGSFVSASALVPEASTWLLLGSATASLAGYVGLQLRARRRKRVA